MVIEDGRPLDARQGVWHAADIFTSLVDNIQETFGLTPIEAMAVGLPVVVSDYDGYRESVRHGVDGYRVSTIQPSAGAGVDLMDSHTDVMLSYPDYVSQASTLIGIDMNEAVEAYVSLAMNKTLRTEMGKSGQQRARAEYDWKLLIPRYMELFEELADVRKAAANKLKSKTWNEDGKSAHWGLRYPRRSDPFHSFQHYATKPLDVNLTLLPGPLFIAERDARIQALKKQLERPVYEVARPLLQFELLAQMLDGVAAQQAGLAIGRWLGVNAADKNAQHCLRQLGWLVKAGFIIV